MFISEQTGKNGISPSFDEMKDALELKSKSGIHRLVSALEERGYIRRLPHRARALEVLRVPGTVSAGANIERGTFFRPPRRSFRPSLVKSGQPRDTITPLREHHAPSASASLELPVLGCIAAGTPLEAIQHEVGRFHVSQELVGKGKHFVLKVRGESMTGAGIHHDDFVIIKYCDNANAGDIVVALIDNREATLKKLRKKGASIALEAANPAFETRIYGPDRIRIQGKLVALMRNYS